MTEKSKKVDFEVGDLLTGRVVGKAMDGNTSGYKVKLATGGSSEGDGFYPSPLDIADGTRLEVCFECLDGDTIKLAPKSTLKKRQHLRAIEEGNSPDFSPLGGSSPKGDSAAADSSEIIDFRPPSDFNIALLSLLLSWKLIDRDQELELKDKLLSGDWELVGLLKRLNLFTPGELAAIDFGRNLVKREKISWTEFRQAFFAEVSAGICFQDSPLVKGV